MKSAKRATQQRDRPVDSPALDAASLLNDPAVPAIILDLNGQLLAATATAAELISGNPHAELLGHTLTEFLSPESQQHWPTFWAQLRTAKTEVRHLFDLRPPNGAASKSIARRIEFIGRPIKQGRRLVAIHGQLQTPIDLPGPAHAAKHAVRTVDLTGVLDNTSASILVLDRTGAILWANSAIAHDFGCARESLPGRALFDLILADERERFQRWLAEINAAASPTPLTLETYFRRDDALLDRGRFSGIYAAAQQQVIVTYHRLNTREDSDGNLNAHVARLEASNAILALAIVGQSLDPDVALQAALLKTLEVLRAEAGVVMLVDVATGDLVFKTQVGWRTVDSVSSATRVKTSTGLADLVVQTDRPVVVDDIQNDTRVSLAGFRQSGVRSAMLVPMHARAQVIGVLTIMEYSARLFTAEDVDLLSTVADQMSIGLANAQLYQSEQKQRRLAEALGQIAGMINSTLDLDSVLNLIVDQLQRVVPYDSVSLALNQQNHFHMVMFRGYTDADMHPAEYDISDLPTTQLILEARKPIYIQDTLNDPRWVRLAPRSRIRSWLGVPLLSKNEAQTLGLLFIDNYQVNAYSNEDVQAAFTFAAQAATAIENAHLYAESQHRAELMSALNSVSATVSQSLELEPTLWSALDKALEVVNVEAGAISLVDESNQDLVIRVHRGWRQQDLANNLRIKLGQGLSGQAILTGEVVVTGSLENESRLAVPAVRGEGVQSMVLAPMRARGRVVGVLGVMSYRPHVFDRQSVETVKSIADQIGLAIDNVQLLERESRRAAQLTLLNEVARDVVSSLDLTERLNQVAYDIWEKFGYYSVQLLMVSDDGQQVVMRAGSGERAELVDRDYHQPIGQGLIGWVAQSGEMVIVNDVRNDPRYINPLPDRADPVRSELAVPLHVGQQVIGVLDIQQLEANAFTEDDAQLIQSLADQLVVAITNAQLYDQARQRVAELTALQETSLQVTSSLDLWTVLNAIAHSALTLIQATTVHIYLFNADLDELAFTTALWNDGERTPAVVQPLPDDPVAQAARTGKLVIDNDRGDQPWGTPPLLLRSLAALPLKRADRVVGVLLTAFRSAHDFVPEQVRVLMLLSDQAAVAIDHARLYANESRRSAHLSLINSVGRQATSTLDLSALLERASIAIRQSFGYFHVSLLLRDAATNELVLKAYSGGFQNVLKVGYRQPTSVGIMGWAVQQAETVLANDVGQDPRYHALPDQLEVIHSELAVPIIRNEKVIGVLNVEDLEYNAFSPDDVRAMETLAYQVAIAIENARLYEAANQRVAELVALQEISLQVTASLDTLAVLNTIAQNTLLLTRADDVHLFLYEPDTDKMVFGTALWRNGSREPAVSEPRRNGLTWSVFLKGQPIVINDARHHPIYASDLAQSWGVASIAGFPLKRADAILGVFNVAFTELHTFTIEEIRVITLLSDLAAIAVGNARLYEQTKRRLDEISALHEISIAATGTLDFSEITERTVRTLHRTLGYEYIALFLVNEDGRHIDLYATSGLESEIERHSRILIGQGIVGSVVAKGQLLNVPDVLGEPRYLAGISITRSELCIPLRVGDRVIGAIDLQSPQLNAFSGSDERLLLTIAGQWAVILENARLYKTERLRRQQLEGLQVTAAAIGAELEVNALLQLIVQEASHTFSAPATSLLLWDSTNTQLHIHASQGLSGDFVQQAVITYEEVQWAIDPAQASETSTDHTSRANSQPLRIYDLPATLIDSPQRALYAAENLTSLLRVPLVSGGQMIGLLDIYHKNSARYLGEDEAELANIFASQVAIAIENARLYAETHRRLDEVTILFEVARAGASVLDLNQVLDRMLDAVRRTLRYETFEFILYDPATEVLHTRAAYGFLPNSAPIDVHLGEGLVGWAALTGQPALVNDVSHDPRYIASQAGTRSELAVPLKASDRIVGVMNVESAQLNAFTHDDERLLMALGGQLSIIIVNARLYEETQQRLAEVSTLYSFAQQLTTSLDLAEVLDSIVSTLKQVLKCRGVSIALLTPDTQVLEIRAAAGIQTKWKESARLKVGEGISGQVAATAKVRYVPDTHLLSDFIFFDPVVRSLLVVPLMVKDRVIGTLAIDQMLPDAFTENDERLLTIAAAQAAIVIENAQLYADIKERANKLEQAYKELQEIDQLKDELVQNVSHELRTPLTFIKGYVELLLESDMGPLNDGQRDSLVIVADKTNALTRLVGNIIFLQQIERESLELTVLEMGQIARMALQSCEITATGAGISLRLDASPGLPKIPVDRDRINQVFDNLLGNAIKFSPRGGTITITVRDIGNALKISVADTGIGIPADKLLRIFDRFYQVDGSATRHFGGAGLGLAITKRIVEAHGGRIWAESKIGEGSQFIFTLPKQTAESMSAEAKRS
jgi:GAF domain-containing protein